jgi:transcriptional regulator with XRE-family HTH domain
MLDWSQKELARRAGIAASTLNRVERDNSPLNDVSRVKIQEALVEAGIEFFSGLDGSGSGVRFSTPEKEAQIEAAQALAPPKRKAGQKKSG